MHYRLSANDVKLRLVPYRYKGNGFRDFLCLWLLVDKSVLNVVFEGDGPNFAVQNTKVLNYGSDKFSDDFRVGRLDERLVIHEASLSQLLAHDEQAGLRHEVLIRQIEGVCYAGVQGGDLAVQVGQGVVQPLPLQDEVLLRHPLVRYCQARSKRNLLIFC